MNFFLYLFEKIWYHNAFFPGDKFLDTLGKICSFKYIKETFFSKEGFIEHNMFHGQGMIHPELHQCLYDLLKEFNKILEKEKIIYFLDSGSLLGCYREGKIIAHDDDIDVCLFPEEFEKLKMVAYRDNRYELQINPYQTLYDYNNMVSAQFIDKTSCAKIDIFCLRKIDNKDDRYFTSFIHIAKDARFGAETRRMYYRKNEVYPLCYKKFGDLEELPLPKCYFLILQRLYGFNLAPI
jgi:hypothetical protein